MNCFDVDYSLRGMRAHRKLYGARDAPEGKGHTFSTHVRRHQTSLEANATVLVCILNLPCA